MSRRRSAFTAAVVLSVFAFLYSFVLAIPVYISDITALWSARGHAWFGEVLARLMDGFSFLWGSAVTNEGFSPAPVSGWPTLVFIVMLVALVYASLRTGSDSPVAVGGRVLCASVLAGGLTNLFVAVQTVLATGGGLGSLPWVIRAVTDDGVWLGLVVGVLGGYAASVVAVFLAFAAIALRGDRETVGPADAQAIRWRWAAQVGTWGTLPLLVVVLVGGFVWDYGPDADPYGTDISPRQAWVRLVWFAHASLTAPHNPHSLSGSFDTSVWLPRTLTSAALVVLVWLATLLVVARWTRAGAPGVLGIVLQCWGVVVALAAVLGLCEGALVPPEEFAGSATHWALETVAAGVRFGVCFGWISGVAVALAYRLSRGAEADVEAVEPVEEKVG